MSVYALWRRALRRVERRRDKVLGLRPMTFAPGHDRPGTHCAECAHAWQLLCEAVRLANTLSPGPRYGR